VKISVWLGSAIAAAYIVLGGFAAQAQKAGGTLVMLVQPEPPSLASYLSTSGPIGLVAPKIYDGLLDYDKDLKGVPSLATSWEISDDGKTVTFHLREGVTWHDGEPFTSADVQFTVMEVLKKVHPRGPNSFKEVTSIDTPDAHTAVFNLANPAPYMMRSLGSYESPMVPKHLLAGQDVRSADIANNPVGTGPFKFVEWKPRQERGLLEGGTALSGPHRRALHP
jgi:peptide/nickel transport system substrate-binding protein